MVQDSRPLVGISSCLLGNKVRYDGNDKVHPVAVERLTQAVQLLPICPEAAVGLGIPRAPVQLVAHDNSLKALGKENRALDVSAKLSNMGRIAARVYPDLCGYVTQSRSPSCGYLSTPTHTMAGEPTGFDSGLYINEVLKAQPWLPVIEDTDLSDSKRVDCFLQYCFWLHRWQQLPLDQFREHHEAEIKQIQHQHFEHTMAFLEHHLRQDESPL